MTSALIGLTLLVLALGYVLAPLVRQRSRGVTMAPSRASPRLASRPEASAVDRDALDAAAEALVGRMRDTKASCDRCGPRSEVAPTFCSSCGRHLAPCPHCSDTTQLPNARFCGACGHAL